jgi:hypothetical protein
MFVRHVLILFLLLTPCVARAEQLLSLRAV